MADPYEAAAPLITRDGQAIAAAVLRLAAGSPDIAMAILGVAADLVAKEYPEADRAAAMREFLAAFEEDTGNG